MSFYRGGWCPFCNAELRALQAGKPELDSLKAKLVVLSPETRDLPRQLKQQLGLDLTMLANVAYAVAISFGILFRVSEQTRAHYAGQGYDFAELHGSTEWMLPIPATFVIDQGGVIRYAFLEPDFTIRREPSDVLNKIRELVGSRAEHDVGPKSSSLIPPPRTRRSGDVVFGKCERDKDQELRPSAH